MPRSVGRAIPGSVTRVLIAAIAIAAGCGPPRQPGAPAQSGDDWLTERHATADKPAPSTEPGRARVDRPAKVRFHMQRHFDDLRMIERRLIAGKLDEARALAYLLARPAPDPGMAPWNAEGTHVTDAALALAAAPTLDEACKREPRVSAACAGCHLRAQAAPVFGAPPPLPPDLPTQQARMARHLWATDRLWEAMVGGTDPPWRDGLEVLAETPLPFTSAGTDRIARRLQDLAQDQLSRTATLDERAAAYGEMLVTCTGCHARMASSAR
jgi:cytochrome c553